MVRLACEMLASLVLQMDHHEMRASDVKNQRNTAFSSGSPTKMLHIIVSVASDVVATDDLDYIQVSAALVRTIGCLSDSSIKLHRLVLLLGVGHRKPKFRPYSCWRPLCNWYLSRDCCPGGWIWYHFHLDVGPSCTVGVALYLR